MTKKVKMKFSRDMYYTDRVKPLYLAGEVYEIEDEGKGMISRWLKRGGVIVGEKTEVTPPAPVPAPVVPTLPVGPKPVVVEEKKPSPPAKEEKTTSAKKKQ